MKETAPQKKLAKTRKSATIHDVARTAGVAIGTVSRYLNGYEVRQSNRLAIDNAIEKLAFRRNAMARGMKAGRTDIVGFLVPSFDHFHSGLLEHLAPAFRQAGRTMLTYCHSQDPRMFKEAIAFFANQRIDALVMAGFVDARAELEDLIEREIPVVLYNNDISGLQGDRVLIENASASKRAVRHLIEIGHEKIAVAYGNQNDSSGKHRLDGYKQALAESGIALATEYMHPANWTPEGGYTAIQKFMALPKPPTAIFSCSYPMTMGMLEWMRERGKCSPGDVSLVSFDDTELFRYYDQGITAIVQPIAKMAEAIVDCVSSRISGIELPDIRMRSIDCQIVLRGSSYLGRPQHRQSIGAD